MKKTIKLIDEGTKDWKWKKVDFEELVLSDKFITYEGRGVISKLNDAGVWVENRCHVQRDYIISKIEEVLLQFDEENDNYFACIDGITVCRSSYDHCTMVVNEIKNHIANA